MSGKIIARPYAAAAMDYAHESSAVAAWGDFFATLAQSEDAICAVVRQCAGDEVPVAEALCDLLKIKDTGQRNFLHIAAQNRRLLHIGDIARYFVALRLDADNIAEMHIESARQLNAGQRKDLEKALAHWSGRTVQATHAENPDLLGGVWVRYKDHVWDASVRGRLERLSASFGA